MSKGLIFWVLMLVWAVFYLFTSIGPYRGYGGYSVVVEFVLLLLLGWQVFGKPVQ
jgi:hypothetical protein